MYLLLTIGVKKHSEYKMLEIDLGDSYFVMFSIKKIVF